MYTPSKAHILSIFPLRLEAPRLHNGFVNYEHPPAGKNSILHRTFNSAILSNPAGGSIPPGAQIFTDVVTPCEPNKGYTVITVPDTFTWNRDFNQDKETFIPHPLEASAVAAELVRSWVGDGGHVKPGIRLIDTDNPTAEVVESLRLFQEDQFRNLINEAHVLFAQDKVKDISDLHRAAAKWMGANNLEWVPKIEQLQTKRCVACDETILQKAKVCKFCQTNLVKFCVENGLMPDNTVDPVVAAAVIEFKKKIGKAA